MPDLWRVLVPIVVASALAPLQLTITVFLLRSSLNSAASWVAGMTAARIVQGVLLALAISSGITVGSAQEPTESISLTLMAAAVLFYLAAAQQIFNPVTLETVTPAWVLKAANTPPAVILGLGAAYLTLSVKSTLLNLFGMGVIIQSGGDSLSVLVGALVFITLAEAGHLILLAAVIAYPSRSKDLLSATSVWLSRHSRVIVITMGLAFGTWFLLTALEGLGWLQMAE